MSRLDNLVQNPGSSFLASSAASVKKSWMSFQKGKWREREEFKENSLGLHAVRVGVSRSLKQV